MAALLARFFTATVRGGVSQEYPSNQTSAQAESTRKFRKGHSTNVKARKSITSLFGFAVKVTPVEDGHDALIHTRATCQEAQHYPMYDPTNPEHDPSAISTENPQSPASNKRNPSSPAKVPRWKRSPSPRRPPASARTRTRIQGFADTLRAKANIFYEAQQHSSEEELMPHEVSVPLTPSSAKSICSKKSVRFRSGHSVISNVQPHSSPITIPTKSPPSLSMVNISSTPVFETASHEEKSLGQTARPPQTLPVHIPSEPSPKRTNRPQLSLELDDRIGIFQARPTPMPGTNLPLEDPFHDKAAALVSGHPTSRISAGPIGSDRGYISDIESNAKTNDINAARISLPRMFYAQGTFDPSPRNTKSSEIGTSSPVSDYGEESLKKSPSPAQKALRRTHAFPPTFKMQSSMSRLPSETQYDADAERSDGSEAQKDPLRGEAVNLQHQHERDDADNAEDSEFGVDLFRCKTPDKPRSVAQGPITQGTIPRLTLEKLSSDEMEEVALPLSAGSEAAMRSADHADESFMGVETSTAPEILETRGNQERSAANKLRPTLRPVGSAFEGLENADPVLSGEPTKLETTASPTDIDDRSVRIPSISSENSGSPLHLSPTVSSSSPPRPRWHLRTYQGTDEDIDAGRLEDYSSFAREVAERSTQPRSNRGPQLAPSGTPPPADVPLPISVESARMSMPSFYDTAQLSNGTLWSPFEEPRFVDVAFSVLEASPQTLTQRLCSEGISRSFWKQMGLPDATAPPNNQNPCTENELLDLFASISDRAKASSFPDRGSICDTRPPDYSDGDIIDMQALNAFYGPLSPLSLRVRSQGRHASRTEAGLLETASSSPLSIFSSRQSSLGRPATLVESRQPSSYGAIMNRRSTPDITQPSRLGTTPLQAEPLLHPLDESAFEARPFTAGQSTLPSSQTMQEEVIKGSADAEHYHVAVTSQSKTLGQSARSDTGSRITAPPSCVMPTRKHSSDESQETNESMSSRMQSSTSSGLAVNWSFYAASEDESTGERQYPPTVWETATSQREQCSPGHGDEADSHDIAISNKHQYMADTPKPPKINNAKWGLVGADFHDNPRRANIVDAENASPTTKREI